MKLERTTTGSGRDLALLHGWGMGAAVWDGIAPLLARRFRVHAVSLPGYGASPLCTPYSAESVADALAVSLPQRCIACGWSMGGQAALAWARRAPRQIERLVLIAATPCFVQRHDWPHAMAAGELDAFARSLGSDRDGTLRRFFALQSMGDAGARAVAGWLRARLRSAPAPDPAALASGLGLLRDTDLRAALPEIVQPALVVHGEHDRLVPLAAAQYLAAHLPAGRLEVSRGAAHAPFLSRPDEIAQCLEAFADEG